MTNICHWFLQGKEVLSFVWMLFKISRMWVTSEVLTFFIIFQIDLFTWRISCHLLCERGDLTRAFLMVSWWHPSPYIADWKRTCLPIFCKIWHHFNGHYPVFQTSILNRQIKNLRSLNCTDCQLMKANAYHPKTQILALRFKHESKACILNLVSLIASLSQRDRYIHLLVYLGSSPCVFHSFLCSDLHTLTPLLPLEDQISSLS